MSNIFSSLSSCENSHYIFSTTVSLHISTASYKALCYTAAAGQLSESEMVKSTEPLRKWREEYIVLSYYLRWMTWNMEEYGLWFCWRSEAGVLQGDAWTRTRVERGENGHGVDLLRLFWMWVLQDSHLQVLGPEEEECREGGNSVARLSTEGKQLSTAVTFTVTPGQGRAPRETRISPVTCPGLTQPLSVHQAGDTQLIRCVSACQSFPRSTWQRGQVTHIIRVVFSISATHFVLFKSSRAELDNTLEQWPNHCDHLWQTAPRPNQYTTLPRAGELM